MQILESVSHEKIPPLGIHLNALNYKFIRKRKICQLFIYIHQSSTCRIKLPLSVMWIRHLGEKISSHLNLGRCSLNVTIYQESKSLWLPCKL